MARFEDLFPPVVSFGARTLLGGERGTDVAVLQVVYDEMLRVMNPPQGPIGSPVHVNGVYDAATVRAVQAIQSYFGIAADGVAGPDTYWLFGQGVGPHVSFGGPRYGSRTLREGVHGGDVTVLQNRLNCFRYAGALGHPADGVFGPGTAAAVRQFQGDADRNGDTGVEVDGVVAAVTGNASWIYTYAGGRGLLTARANDGFDVVFVQRVLADLGYYRGAIDGYYGRRTQDAVSAFQAANHITADGEAGPQTFHAIGRANPAAAPRPLPVPPLGPARLLASEDCTVTLIPTLSCTEPCQTPGGALWLRQSEDGGIAVAIAAMFLPPPSTFDPAFDQYVLVTEPALFPDRALSLTFEGLGLWTEAREQSYGSPIPANTTVTIAPGSDRQQLGPVVLQGRFADCG